MSNPIDALREAVRVSPDNVPLRKHLAESLMNVGDTEAAEEEYRAALAHAPDDPALKFGLATAFWAQGKKSETLVLLEPFVQEHDDHVPAKLLLVKVLLANGDTDTAHTHYADAVDLNPDAADDELAEKVGYEAFSDAFDDEPERVLRVGDVGPDFDDDDVSMVKSDISFNDVGGMDDLKENIRIKVIYPITNAELFAQYGKTVGGGILMYGPPGCGKTLIAKATAGEIDANFLAVGIDDVLDMYFGNSEQKLHALFEQARAHAPCVLFFDEVDALGTRRSDLRQSAGKSLVNQFLTELDGVQSNNDGVLILAATNSPWTLDGAFRRPGRFDDILFIPPPDETARAAILKILLAGKPVADVQLAKVAKKAAEFTGADLKAVVDRTVEAKLTNAMKTGRPEPITTADLVAAAKKHKSTCREWFASAKNHALYANESGLYDDVLEYLNLKKR